MNRNPKLSLLFAVGIFLVALTVVRAQSTLPISEPFTELGKPDCEMLWAQLDTVSSEMSKHPSSTLIIDITARKDNPPHINRYWYEFVRSYFAIRKISPDRWRIRTLPLEQAWNFKFWIVSPGAELASVEETALTWDYSPETKPFLFTHGESYMVEVGVCLYVDELAMLADAVKENPGSRVNVVLIARSEPSFQRRKLQTLKELGEYIRSLVTVSEFSR